MRPYSDDLRERIVQAVERGEHSQRQLARIFSVSLSWLVRLLQRKRHTGSLQPTPHAGGPTPKLDSAAQERLLQLVCDQPDATLAELRDRLGIPCSLMTIARALKRHRISRKKKTVHAQEQDTPEVQADRAVFEQNLAGVDPEHLVYVDEMGAHTAMIRTHGRAPIGERVVAAAPGHWANLTLIAGLRLAGVVAPLVFAGAVDQEVWRTYALQVLVPTLQPGDVVVFDNLAVHKDPVVIAAIQAVGALGESLPVYSPDKTPIEEWFSKTKEYLRSVGARTTETIVAALGSALDGVTSTDIIGWFQHRAAYAMNS